MPLLADALHTQQALYSDANERTAHTLAALGSTHKRLNHPEVALAMYAQAAAQYRKMFPSGDYRLASMLYNQAQIYREQGRLVSAEACLHGALEIEQARLPAVDRRVLDRQVLLGQGLLGEHREQTAQPLLAAVYQAAVAGGPPLQRERDLAGSALKQAGAVGLVP